MIKKLPIEFFTPEGFIQSKYQEMLSKDFGFDKKHHAQTKYRLGKFKFGAITIYKMILLDYSFLQVLSRKEWFAIIVHEQVHREDICMHPQGAIGFYLSYLIGWIKAGFSYRNNEYEVKAYEMEEKAKQYWEKML